MQKLTIFLVIGISLIAMGGALYFLMQQPFVNCPSFMGLAVGAIPQNIVDMCQIPGSLQIIGSAIFVVGAGLAIYGVTTKYWS